MLHVMQCNARLRKCRLCCCRTLGGVVQDRLSRWAAYDPSLFTAPLCDLVVLDRGHDPVAPAVHPFHYASMAHDLADLRGGVFRCAPAPLLR